MLLPVAKMTSGLVAVATTVASKCTSNACLQVAVNKAAIAFPAALSTEATVGTVSLTTLNLLRTMRGGAVASTVIDFSRESLTIQGMATYGAITALMMNASLRLFTATNFKNEQSRIVRNMFYISSALCLISGAFTAILFQLLTIYSKSALGMSNDEGYLAFKAATRVYRNLGFRCFLTEMISFVVAFMAGFYNTLWTNARELQELDGKSRPTLTLTGKIIFGGSAVLVLTGAYTIRSVLTLATQNIFCTATNDFASAIIK